jgi:hypothetical protein
MRGATRVMLCVMSVAAPLSCLVTAGQAAAEITDGNKLFADCQDGDNPNARDSTYKWETCFGYISGVADALVPGGLYCVPGGVTAGQVRHCQSLHPRSSRQAIHVRTSIDC